MSSVDRAKYNAHLHAAVQQKDLEWARMALTFGADPNCMDEDGNTPLHMILANPCEVAEEWARLLMQSGACLHSRNKKGSTPLDVAEEGDRWDLALVVAAFRIDELPGG